MIAKHNKEKINSTNRIHRQQLILNPSYDECSKKRRRKRRKKMKPNTTRAPVKKAKG